MLDDLRPAGRQSVMLGTYDRAKSAKAMAAMDALNRRFGRGTIRPAAVPGVKRDWQMRQNGLSPRFTTELAEVMVAEAF